MAKRTKSGGEIATGGQKWDQVLTTCPFEEENWSPCVAWVVGQQSEDFNHIEALNVIVQTGIRKLFSVITKEQLYLEVREFGNPKNKKAKESVAHSEICENVKVFLDANDPVPSALLAKLIKWKMMALKDLDIKRRAHENKPAADKKKGKDASKERSKSPKKGGKKSPEQQQAKEGSKLKKRGEEDEENKYIDDEPDDGAQYYILVTGFHDPYLFHYLEAINVKVNCVISISSADYSEHKNTNDEDDKLENDKKMELKKFWTDLLPVLQQEPDSSSLHDIARLDYEVSTLISSSETLETEQKVNYSMVLFENISVMLYNLLDAKRLYLTYLNNTKLIHVPVFKHKETTPSPHILRSSNYSKSGTHDKMQHLSVDMRYYIDLMNTIPQESVSVALIMHCMLEQVTATEQGIEPPSEQVVPVTEGFNSEMFAYFAQMTSKLGLTSEEQEMLTHSLNFPPKDVKKVTTPLLINCNDNICHRTHHLKPHYGFDAGAAERSILQFLPISKLLSFDQPLAAEVNQVAVRLQELLHYFAEVDLSTTEIDHVLKQFVFECIDLMSCDNNGFPLERLKEGVHQPPIPYDDPYPVYKVMIPGYGHTHNQQQDYILPVHTHKDDKGVCGSVSDVEKEMSQKKLSVSSTQSTDFRKGILVSSRSSGSSHSQRHSIVSSVHFDVPLEEEETELHHNEYFVPNNSVLELSDGHIRNMDNWCFVEHFKPDILLQVLREATLSLPYIETYVHKRDQSLMIVLHNPYNDERQNILDWHKELHSNAGFRNYLEYTAESIQIWLKKKDAEYQAQLLSKEVANINKEESDKLKALEKTDKKGKRSPQRSATAKTKSPRGSGSNSPEKPNIPSNPYIRPNSLKAWQEEQAKIALEEDEKDKVKLEKRSRSAQKIKEKLEKEKEKTGKQDKSGAKSPQRDGELTPTHSAHSQLDDSFKAVNEPIKDEPIWAFCGYDTGNKLMHMLGSTSTQFPCDGGTIKTERTEILQGSVFVRSVVEKDGHIFSVHVINPREDLNLPEDYLMELESKLIVAGNKSPIPEAVSFVSSACEQINEDEHREKLNTRSSVVKYAVSQFGSITANLSDGMILTLSQFGPTGESYLQPYRPTMSTVHVSESLSRISGAVSPFRSKTKLPNVKGTANTEIEKEKQELSGDESEVQKEKVPEIPKQEFQELLVTCPDGLSLKYFLQSSIGVVPRSESDRHLVVRQSYSYKTSGVQNCESSRLKYIQTEISRVITAEGDVVKNMVDGSVEILSADGTVSRFTGIWADNFSHPEVISQRDLVSQTEKQVTETLKKAGKNATKNNRSKSLHSEEVVEPAKTAPVNAGWVITYPGGERIQVFKENGHTVDLESLPVYFASDPQTQQTMITREDQVRIVHFPDGTIIVEHSDGTRISTYYRDITHVEECSLDNNGDISDQKMCVQTVKFVKVECPAYATVEYNTVTSENLTVFGSDTSINVFPDGYYMIHHNKGGRIEIDTGGTMTYFPKRSRFIEQETPNNELQYVFNHNAKVIVETVDSFGTVYNVQSNGESVVKSTLSEDTLSTRINQLAAEYHNGRTFYDRHFPRYFIIHADGSGTELLRYEDVAEYLILADNNPAAAVLKEALPGHPGVTAITILKPYLMGVSEKWLKKYDLDDIVPVGLRCRDLKTLPPHEYKKPGPKFGTNVGKGLNIGTVVKTAVRIPILKCPEKLEFRQLLQYKPVTSEIRQKVSTALKEYATAVMERTHAEELMAIADPRSENEKNLAHDLKSLTEIQNPKTKEFQPEQVKVIYEQAVAPCQNDLVCKPTAKRTEKDWDQIKKEKEEETEAKNIIKNKIFEPYFNSELGKTFYEIKDNGATKPIPQTQHGTVKAVNDRLNKSSHAKSSAFIQNVPLIQEYDPCKSSSSVEFLPQPSKPQSSKPQPGSSSNLVGSVDNQTHPKNIYGQPRAISDLNIPTAIRGGKPGAHPNIKFDLVEEPVRRKIRTASIGGAHLKSLNVLTKMRGLICNPQKVDFGTLKEGFMYSMTVTLTNTGIDACRFKIRQPAPKTGLRIKYSNKSIAAGMSSDLILELYAITSEQEDAPEDCKFFYTVEIITETDYLELPVIANVLTNEAYDNRAVAPDIEIKSSAVRITRRPHQSVSTNVPVTI